VHDQQRLGQVRHGVGEGPPVDPFERGFHRVGAHDQGKLLEAGVGERVAAAPENVLGELGVRADPLP
jgi:hypothetical protein